MSGTCHKTLCFPSACPWHAEPCTCTAGMDSVLQGVQHASQPVGLLRARAVTVVIWEYVRIAVVIQQACTSAVAVCQEEILDQMVMFAFLHLASRHSSKRWI